MEQTTSFTGHWWSYGHERVKSQDGLELTYFQFLFMFLFSYDYFRILRLVGMEIDVDIEFFLNIFLLF